MNAAAKCTCGWTHVVTEPEYGQSLFGTLGWYMARHSSKTGHGKNYLAIDWERTA